MNINSLREYRQLYLNWLNVFLHRTHIKIKHTGFTVCSFNKYTLVRFNVHYQNGRSSSPAPITGGSADA